MFQKKNKPIVISSQEQLRPVVSEGQLNEAITAALDKLYHRFRGLETYSGRLDNADFKVKEIIDKISDDIRWTYRIMTYIHLVSYIMGVVVIIAGLLLVFIIGNPELNPIGYVCIIGGILTMLFLLPRNPMRNVRYLVTNAAKLGFAYSSYMRQMHQVDTAFKQLLGSDQEISADKLEAMFKMTQDSVDEVLAAISQMLNETDG